MEQAVHSFLHFWFHEGGGGSGFKGFGFLVLGVWGFRV